MTYADAIAALESAKVSGDIAAIIAAADALAKAGSAPVAKPARTPRAPKDERPAWFTADAKAKGKASRIKHSLAVTFEDGQSVRVNAWQVAADRPVAVGRALHVAIEFIRQRRGSDAGFRAPVAAIESAQLVAGPNDGESFDGAECSGLTEAMRARIEPVARPADTLESLMVRREWLAGEVVRREAALARVQAGPEPERYSSEEPWAKALAESVAGGRRELAALDARIVAIGGAVAQLEGEPCEAPQTGTRPVAACNTEGEALAVADVALLEAVIATTTDDERREHRTARLAEIRPDAAPAEALQAGRENRHDRAAERVAVPEERFAHGPEWLAFMRNRVGADWSVHTRITAKVRERHPNPIRRREYAALQAKFIAMKAAMGTPMTGAASPEEDRERRETVEAAILPMQAETPPCGFPDPSCGAMGRGDRPVVATSDASARETHAGASPARNLHDGGQGAHPCALLIRRDAVEPIEVGARHLPPTIFAGREHEPDVGRIAEPRESFAFGLCDDTAFGDRAHGLALYQGWPAWLSPPVGEWCRGMRRYP